VTLFDDLTPPSASAPGSAPSAPLAERLRPRTLADVVGQEAVVGNAGFLRRAIADDSVPSLIFWGPPGCGKTTLAKIVAAETKARFVPFSAVTSGIKEVKAVMVDASRYLRAQGDRTLLFVDEIHRFNKAQQDAFLPYVEQGDVVLVGATTENPSFELNAALLSRCRVVVLERLSSEALVTLLERALKDAEVGLASAGVALEPSAFEQIAQLASGDARRALNLLELVVSDATADERSSVEEGDVERVAQQKILVYDKAGESQRSTSRCERATRMGRSIGSVGCWLPARIRSTWRGAWCDSRARTSGSRILRHCRKRSRRGKRIGASGLRRVSWR